MRIYDVCRDTWCGSLLPEMIEYHRTSCSMQWNQYKYNVHEQYKSNSFIALDCIVICDGERIFFMQQLWQNVCIEEQLMASHEDMCCFPCCQLQMWQLSQNLYHTIRQMVSWKKMWRCGFKKSAFMSALWQGVWRPKQFVVSWTEVYTQGDIFKYRNYVWTGDGIHNHKKY